MEDGATLHDTGKKLFSSEQIEEQALVYAQKKWGKDVVFRKNIILIPQLKNESHNLGL